MLPSPIDDRPYFLSTLTASPGERRLAGMVLLLSLLIFALLAPFAKVPLIPLGAFIPAYESSLVVLDLITVALLGGQYLTFHSRALLVLASGYLFTALITVTHALTFPGLYAPTGLLGAGPQTTAWLYMFWHGAFPLFVIAYTRLKTADSSPALSGKQAFGRMLAAGAAVLALVVGFTVLTTAGQDLLPAIMNGHRYTPAMVVVVTSVWMLSVIALGMLWLRRPHSVLDLWLMVVMCAWLIDIALSAILNQGRFDLGFYAGRVYGLLAASFVLLVLLAESGILYRKLMQLTETLRRLTLQDGLTGIANRRAFDSALDAECRRALRSNQPLALMMVDVDHFKSFNDRYGHVMGDQCLQAVATALQSTVARASDLVARYGGEEFAVLLPHTDATAAARLAERIRTALAELSIPNQGSAGIRVTVSIGVADIRPEWIKAQAAQAPAEYPHSHGQMLVARADEQLYSAKSSGRNRVAVNAGGESATGGPIASSRECHA
ncbi:MAG TPA: sensor domain-containing diguanylate cyclase [Azonexus sp.]